MPKTEREHVRSLAKRLRRLLVLRGWTQRGKIGQSVHNSVYFNVISPAGCLVRVRLSDHRMTPARLVDGWFVVTVSWLQRHPARDLLRQLRGIS